LETTALTEKEQLPAQKLDYVDALRGLAILGVVIVHTSRAGSSDLPSVLNKITGEGSRGVQLFYLASAFTLFLSYYKRNSNELNPIRNFFLRRFFRIAPMYYLGVGYYLYENNFGPSLWLAEVDHITFGNILSNITFLHGFNPYHINSIVPGGWSIAVEMTFYLTLPILFVRIKNLNQAFNFLLFTLILRLALNAFFVHYPLVSHDRLWGGYLIKYFPSQLPVFALGIMLFFMVAKQEMLSSISGKSILIFVGLILVQLVTKTNFIFANHIIFSIAFLLLGIGVSKYRPRILVNKLMNYIGKISFSIYLVHFAVIFALTDYNLIDFHSNAVISFAIRFVVVLALSIGIASLTYSSIEEPFVHLGKRIITRMERITKDEQSKVTDSAL
jgi:peptidoglycan/LPS O-acetylase OafA/YrhL